MRRLDPNVLIALAGAAVGLAFAAYLYGFRLLDPRSVEWLMGESDPLHQFLGWDFFRRDSWHFPPGSNPTFGTLADTSIVYSDSVPLLAILLKPFSAWLPDLFQYLGLLLFLDFAANGASAAAVALRLTGQPVTAVLFSVLTVALPSITLRGIGGHGHVALTAVWTLWLALLLLIDPQADARAGRRAGAWLLLLVTSVALHFYLFFMVAVAWSVGLGARLVAIRRGGTGSLRRWLGEVAGTVAVVAVVLFLLGYFQLAGSPGDRGYGYYSAEIFTFLNPRSAAWFLSSSSSLSAVLPGWRSPIPGQYEGQAYLGLGALTLVGAGIVAHWRRDPERVEVPPALGPAWVAGIVLFVLALGNRWVVGSWVVNVPVPDGLANALAMVRSSGRFSWFLGLVVLAASIVAVSRRWRRAAPLLVAACAVLQVVDLAPWHTHVRTWARRDVPPWPVLSDPAVAAAFEGRCSVSVLPPGALAHVPPLAWMAARRGLSINTAPIVRASPRTLAERASGDLQAVRAGALSPSTVYVLAERGLVDDVCSLDHVRCRVLNPSVAVATVTE